MENTLFISLYYNNPHFIELQYKTFSKFVQDDWAFFVLNDSEEHTKAVISGDNARKEIKAECEKYGIRNIMIPQIIHKFEKDGGLVKEEPNVNLSHTTERHQANLKWIFLNHKKLGFDQFKYLVLFDSDMFWKKPVNIQEYMQDYDIMGACRDQILNLDHLSPPFSEEFLNMQGKKIKFFTMCLLFINMQTIKNLETMDNSSFRAITDTGGRSFYYIQNNPQYKYKFMFDSNSANYRCDYFSKYENVSENEGEPAEILHFRSGSNWNLESLLYSKAKLQKMLKRYLPEFADPNFNLDQDVISSNREHFLAKGSI